jgi:predicted O-methyltransferase YrrM
MLDQLKSYAKENNIPIIDDAGLLFLKTSIIDYQVKDVLEIGSAIGYSALAMASYGCQVDTMERDLYMLEICNKHLTDFDYNHQVKLIEADAIYYEGELRMYDLIFIDAAKAQYQRFFEKYSPYLKPNGIVICDNLRFHDLDVNKVNRNTRQLIKKLESFKVFLSKHEDYDTTFYQLGDGMSLTKRKIR